MNLQSYFHSSWKNTFPEDDDSQIPVVDCFQAEPFSALADQRDALQCQLKSTQDEVRSLNAILSRKLFVQDYITKSMQRLSEISKMFDSSSSSAPTASSTDACEAPEAMQDPLLPTQQHTESITKTTSLHSAPHPSSKEVDHSSLLGYSVPTSVSHINKRGSIHDVMSTPSSMHHSVMPLPSYPNVCSPHPHHVNQPHGLPHRSETTQQLLSSIVSGQFPMNVPFPPGMPFGMEPHINQAFSSCLPSISTFGHAPPVPVFPSNSSNSLPLFGGFHHPHQANGSTALEGMAPCLPIASQVHHNSTPNSLRLPIDGVDGMRVAVKLENNSPTSDGGLSCHSKREASLPLSSSDSHSLIMPQNNDFMKAPKKRKSKNDTQTDSPSSPKTSVPYAPSPDRPFVCEECGRGFRQKAQLTTHERIHTGQRPYGCSICGKRFRQQSHVIQHLKVHTGEKSHVCELCNKAFRQRTALEKHIARQCKNRRTTTRLQNGQTLWYGLPTGVKSSTGNKEYQRVITTGNVPFPPQFMMGSSSADQLFHASNWGADESGGNTTVMARHEDDVTCKVDQEDDEEEEEDEDEEEEEEDDEEDQQERNSMK